MASANAGLISGRELIRVIQGGQTVWLNRTQFASLIELPSNPPANRPYAVPTTFLGTETFEAIQDGSRIQMSAADMAVFLISDANGPINSGSQPTTLTGAERIVGRQDKSRVAFGVDEFLSARIAGASTVTLPANFLSRWTPDFSISRSGGGYYFTTLDYTTLKPAIAKTYYVRGPANSNGAAGSDAAAGTLAAPLLSFSTAIGKSDVDEIVFDCSSGDYIMLGARGANNTQPARDISVRVIGPGRPISVATISSALPTWVNTAGAVYKTTIAAASARSVIDLMTKDADGFYPRMADVGSTSAVASTPGSWFHDGTDLHVQAPDSRNLVGDTKMLPCGNNGNLRIPSANRTIYVDGVDFVGGQPFQYVAAGAVDPLVVSLNCTFQGSSNQTINGTNITGPGRFYFYRCGVGRNWRDQFNYHGNANGDPKVFENECYTGLGGYVGTSDNASTAHENTAIIRLNGRYAGALNRTIADINDTRSLILGGLIGQARTVATANESLAQQSTNQTWLGGVSIPTGGNPQLAITFTATVAYRDMPAPIRAGTGEDTGTLTAW
jgi:hypothetical protein